MPRIDLIAGLGNPGPKHQETRHNAGFWLVDEVARSLGKSLSPEAKFHATMCRVSLPAQPDRDCWLLKPTTFVNRSGQAVSSIAHFYKIPVENILVVHDDLDLPPGTARLKQGGGHGGHNGLRDIITQLGSNDFMRLRIGIGHPGQSDRVIEYVLGRPSAEDRQQIMAALDAALATLPLLINGDIQGAMQRLHSRASSLSRT